MLINEKRKEIFKLKRRIYMNQGINVQMYSIEPGYPNSANCMFGCAPSTGGSVGDFDPSISGSLALGIVLVGTAVNPDN